MRGGSGVVESREEDPRAVPAAISNEESGMIVPGAVPRAARPRLLCLTVDLEAGDAAQMILTTAPRLQQEGFEVTAASLGRWGPLGDELEDRGIRAMALGTKHPWDPRGAGRLLSLLRRERIQILHGHLFSANLVARVLGRIAGVPVIVTTHHDTDLWMGLPHRLVERMTAPLCDAVIASSEAVRRYALETYGFGPGLVRTFRGAVEIPEDATRGLRRDAVRRELGAGPQDLLVGVVGKLREPKKGLSIFLAAARLLAQDLPRVRFALIGAGPDFARLETRAAEEGVSHRTVFAGLRRDIPDVLAALDLYVHPSVWEGFGLTLLEAMAAGAPVVASRVGGATEAIADGVTGLLVPPGDPRALAAACAILLRDRERARRMGTAGRARAEALFRVDRLVRDLSAFYRGLLARARLASEKDPGPPWRRA